MSLTALQRAQGALTAALAADALGTQFEFCPPAELKRTPAAQLLQLIDCGPWHTLAGQPTEDGELMLLQARMLAFRHQFDETEALQAYRYWLSTEPFSVCGAMQQALLQGPEPLDFSACALARLAPLALLGQHYSLPQVAAWAMADTALTQSALLMQQISALYVMLLAKAVDSGCSAEQLVADVSGWAQELKFEAVIAHSIADSLFMPASAELRRHNPALAALQNVLFQLQYARSLGEAVVDTIRQGGDTGTNAVIVAAVFGALGGIDAVPADWLTALQQCRPQDGVTGVEQPRPETFWPCDVLSLATALSEPADDPAHSSSEQRA
jgi:ADP-ribosyl-[dinitrogen reductase] hydrolase